MILGLVDGWGGGICVVVEKSLHEKSPIKIKDLKSLIIRRFQTIECNSYNTNIA
jgi:hypothetical protein